MGTASGGAIGSGALFTTLTPSLTISGSTVSGNSSQGGSNLIESVSLSANTADAGNGYGGAVGALAGNLSIANSTIAGVASSSALLADDRNRMVQIRIRRRENVTKVAEEVRRALRAEVPDETPALLQGKSANAVGGKQNWLTIGQLNAIAVREERSPPRSYQGHWLLALTVVLALGAFLFWLLLRRRRLANA